MFIDLDLGCWHPQALRRSSTLRKQDWQKEDILTSVDGLEEDGLFPWSEPTGVAVLYLLLFTRPKYVSAKEPSIEDLPPTSTATSTAAATTLHPASPVLSDNRSKQARLWSVSEDSAEAYVGNSGKPFHRFHDDADYQALFRLKGTRYPPTALAKAMKRHVVRVGIKYIRRWLVLMARLPFTRKEFPTLFAVLQSYVESQIQLHFDTVHREYSTNTTYPGRNSARCGQLES